MRYSKVWWQQQYSFSCGKCAFHAFQSASVANVGGNGGNGGDVVLVVDPSVTTLLDFHRSPHRSAGKGTPGQGDHRNGAYGEHLELAVPEGTVVSLPDGTVLTDMLGIGTRYVIAAGGRGAAQFHVVCR